MPAPKLPRPSSILSRSYPPEPAPEPAEPFSASLKTSSKDKRPLAAFLALLPALSAASPISSVLSLTFSRRLLKSSAASAASVILPVVSCSTSLELLPLRPDSLSNRLEIALSALPEAAAILARPRDIRRNAVTIGDLASTAESAATALASPRITLESAPTTIALSAPTLKATHAAVQAARATVSTLTSAAFLAIVSRAPTITLRTELTTGPSTLNIAAKLATNCLPTVPMVLKKLSITLSRLLMLASVCLMSCCVFSLGTRYSKTPLMPPLSNTSPISCVFLARKARSDL